MTPRAAPAKPLGGRLDSKVSPNNKIPSRQRFVRTAIRLSQQGIPHSCPPWPIPASRDSHQNHSRLKGAGQNPSTGVLSCHYGILSLNCRPYPDGVYGVLCSFETPLMMLARSGQISHEGLRPDHQAQNAACGRQTGDQHLCCLGHRGPVAVHRRVSRAVILAALPH